MLQAEEPLETIPYVQKDPEISALTKELAVLEARFAGIKQRYKHKWPEYKEIEEQVRSLQDSIEKQANRLIQSLRNNAILAKENADRLSTLVADQEALQLQLKEKKIKYDVLKRDADQSALLYQIVLQRMKETDITSKNKINNMRPVDLAEAPFKPVKPRWVLTILLGIIGGLGIAVGLAFFVNYLDDSIKSQDDVETYLRLPFLGYIPNIKTNSVVERDLQAHLHPQSNAAEGFRTIRATISLTHKPDKFRVLAVTSTIPSEGKSLVASNLAIVTAQTGLKTLLIDADLRRPSVHKAYQLHSPIGLSSYLTEEANDMGNIVHRTEVPNLDVVCCGPVPSTPSELIGSKRMQEFLQLVGGRYDRVLLDCPPISAVSDPLIISAMSDGVVFVTKFNKIRREHARKSVQRVQNAGIHILGVVLNDIDFEGKDSYYYSYYYYQNRYYASHYKTKPERTREKVKEEPVAKSRNGG
jgi:capsular exopolysaccharide synthesis family protein